MSLVAKYTVVSDTATPRMSRLKEDVTLSSVQAHIGPPLQDLVRRNYAGLPSNKMGGASTHFWQQCADATRWERDPAGVLIITDKVGARQRYEGGKIRKVDKLLAIPANAMAYGKNPSEFPGLKYIQFGRGQDAPKALIMLGPTASNIESTTRGKRHFRETSQQLGMIVMFWLKDEVDQAPNAAVLPTDEQIYETIDHALEPISYDE